MINVLLILFPNQLFEDSYIKKIFDYSEEDNIVKKKIIVLWEHEYFFTKYIYNKNKLVLHRSSMKNYYDNISSKYEKKYINLGESNELLNLIKKSSINQIRFFNPIEKELLEIIQNNKFLKSVIIENLIFPTPYFLNSTNFEKNINLDKILTAKRHDLFYKNQRITYKLMIKKDSSGKIVPEGSKWSFDMENRSPFPKDQVEPKNLVLKSKKRIDYLKEAINYVEKHFSNNYGECKIENFIYPINREEALEWLEFFIKHRLDLFGKYEDALSSKVKFGYHSLLSALTNIGIITPWDIIKKVNLYKKNLASKEGFLRQIIGWREYSYFTYDLYGQNLEKTSIYIQNKNSIPKKVWECDTKIPPIDNILVNVTNNGYSHHIERLMGIGNFLILIGVSIKEIFIWFQTMYIDAYEVFMYPNVYGMLGYAKLNEKTHMMTRPYFSSSNYLIKMSDYKSSEINLDDKIYKWDEIYDGLYYNFINTYSKDFEKIYSSASAVSRWNSFSNEKKKKLLELAKHYKTWIYK